MTIFDDAAAQGNLLIQQLAQARAELAADVVLIADLQKQLADCQSPPPTTFSGIWADSPTYTQFDIWQSTAGVEVKGYRSRGGEGEFDDPFVLPDTLAMAKKGHTVSLQIQPKTGKGPNRRGVLYTDIAAGNWDEVLRPKLAQFADLPGGPYPCEIHSEANVQGPKGQPAAQPYSGTAAEYGPFVRKIHDLAVEVGVRDKLTFVCSLAGPGIWKSGWNAWLTPPVSGLFEVFAIDFYSQPKSGQEKDFSTGASAVAAAARSVGKPWAVFETGCQEKLGDDMYKARWYDGVSTFLANEGHDCHSVWFNTSNDGAGGWMPDTSANALNAWKRLMGTF